MEKSVYTPNDIMLLLGIGRNSAYNLCNSQVFPIRKIGKKILVSRIVFEKWLNGGDFIDWQSAN